MASTVMKFSEDGLIHHESQYLKLFFWVEVEYCKLLTSVHTEAHPENPSL